MSFQPTVDQEIILDGVTYRVAEHPAAPGMPYGQEGRAAIVYQLVTADSQKRALKVFKPRYRVPGLVTLADRLAPYASLPGLQVCRRRVLAPQNHAELLRQHPDLTYAVLMPWVEGPTWMEVLLAKRALTPEESLGLARSLAEVLVAAEQHNLAHCDLSASNVMLPALAGGVGVALVDVEGMYGPGLERPREILSGSPGYAHRTAPEGIWGIEADRFAGAVLLAEMLGWCDERVRRTAWGENYFEPQEMQRDSSRYRLLREVLQERWGDGVAGQFERAWHSETLVDCATFGEWWVVLPEQVLQEAPAVVLEDVEAEPVVMVESLETQQARSVTYNVPPEEVLAEEILEATEPLPAQESVGETETVGVEAIPPGLRSVEEMRAEAARIAQVGAVQDVGQRTALEGAELPEPLEEPVGAEVSALLPPHDAAAIEPEREEGLPSQLERRPPQRRRKRIPGWVWAAGAMSVIGILAAIVVLGLVGLGLVSYPRDGVGVIVTPTTQRIRPATPMPTVTSAPATQRTGEVISVDSAARVVLVQTLHSDGYVESVAFDTYGSLLAWGGFGEVWIYDVESDRQITHWHAHTNQTHSVRFGYPEAFLISGGVDAGGGRVRFWDSSYQEIRSAQIGQAGWGVRLDVSTSGNLLVASSANQLQVWNVQDMTPLWSESRCGDCPVFSPDGRMVASVCQNASTLSVYDARTGEVLNSWLIPGHYLLCPAFSPNGQSIATGASDNTIHLFSWDGSESVFRGHDRPIEIVIFSPDGTVLASGSDDNTVRLWRVSDGTLLRVLEGHTDSVGSLAFSPDGTLLASGSDDGTVRLWGVR